MTDEIAIPQLRWLPIAIAPRDGSWIIAKPSDRYEGVGQFRWMEKEGMWQSRDVYNYYNDDLFGWLPMPEGGEE